MTRHSSVTTLGNVGFVATLVATMLVSGAGLAE